MGLSISGVEGTAEASAQIGTEQMCHKRPSRLPLERRLGETVSDTERSKLAAEYAQRDPPNQSVKKARS